MENRDSITIEWVNSVDDIPAALWDACFPPPLEGRWWYAALEGAGLDDQFTFSYGIIKSNNQEIGIAPSFLMDVPIDLVMPPVIAWIMRNAGKIIRPLRYQRTLFIGSPCADEGTVGLLPGITLDRVAVFLHESLAKRARQYRASIMVWKDFPESTGRHLDTLCTSHRLFKLVSYPGATMPLPSGTFDRYLQSLDQKKRYKYKRKLRESHARGELLTEIVQHPDKKTMDDMFSLFRQTYLKGKTKFEELNPRFFDLIAEADVSYFVLLRRPESNALVAFMLCFQLGSLVINKFIGMDYQLVNEWNLYFRLYEPAIKWALAIGATEFQSGQTGYRAKFDLGHKPVPLTNYCKHRNPVINAVFALIASRTTWSDLDNDLKNYVQAYGQP